MSATEITLTPLDALDGRLDAALRPARTAAGAADLVAALGQAGAALEGADES